MKKAWMSICAVALVCSLGVILSGCLWDIRNAPPMDAEVQLIVKQDFAAYLNQGEYTDVEVEDVAILRYYGTFKGSVVVMMTATQMEFEQTVSTESVGGSRFTYTNSNFILVWNDGEFLRLQDAFDQGLLSTVDLLLISARH
jgi:hypothetical protein